MCAARARRRPFRFCQPSDQQHSRRAIPHAGGGVGPAATPARNRHSPCYCACTSAAPRNAADRRDESLHCERNAPGFPKLKPAQNRRCLAGHRQWRPSTRFRRVRFRIAPGLHWGEAISSASMVVATRTYRSDRTIHFMSFVSRENPPANPCGRSCLWSLPRNGPGCNPVVTCEASRWARSGAPGPKGQRS